MEKVGVWIVDKGHLRLISERFLVQCLSTNVHRIVRIEHTRGAYPAEYPHLWVLAPQVSSRSLVEFSTRYPHL